MYVEDAEDTKKMYMYFRRLIQMHTTNGLNHGQMWGLDVVEKDEVEAEVEKIQEDEEVAHIYEDSKNKQQKIKIGGYKLNTVL